MNPEKNVSVPESAKGASVSELDTYIANVTKASRLLETFESALSALVVLRKEVNDCANVTSLRDSAREERDRLVAEIEHVRVAQQERHEATLVAHRDAMNAETERDKQRKRELADEIAALRAEKTRLRVSIDKLKSALDADRVAYVEEVAKYDAALQTKKDKLLAFRASLDAMEA